MGMKIRDGLNTKLMQYNQAKYQTLIQVHITQLEIIKRRQQVISNYFKILIIVVS